jgi:hypothetical protein
MVIVAFAPGAHAGALERDRESRHDGSREEQTQMETASKSDSTDEEATEEAERWYGWQTLVVDGVAVASLPLAGVVSSGGNENAAQSILVGGLLTYYIGAPTVHFAHGRVGIGFASLGLRVALPIVGAGLAVATCHDDTGEFGCFGPVFLGLAGGIITPIVLDAAVFGYEPEPTEAAARNSFPVQFGLSLHPKHPGFMLGLKF